MQPRVTSGDVIDESDGNGSGSQGEVAEVKVDPTMQIGQGDIKSNICELPESTKPTVHFSKKKEEAGQLQNKMIDMLNKDDDEIDLVFPAWYKRIKRNLSDKETEDLMEELNATVTKHVRKARAKRIFFSSN